MSEGKTLATMGALALMWGSSFLWIKVGLDSFSPVQLVLIRLVLGTTVLLALCAAYRHRLPARRRVWGHLAVAAMFHNALPFLLFAIGEQTVDSGVTGIINSTTPLWALAVALVWRIERRLNRLRMLGLLLGVAGTVLIFAPWQSTGLLSWGALACLAASASYGFVFVYEGRFLVETGASPIALAAAQMISASGFMLLAVPVGGLNPIHLETGPLVAVVVLGIFSTGIAFALNYRLISAAGAVAASTVGYLLPVVSVLMGTIFLSEALNLRIVAGMVVVLAGVGLTRVRGRAVQVPAPATATEANPGEVVRS
ncbi:Permease of the drug/metabolite transporter (DMT) superfamily [Amycolatopsis marina]|uniref:Permease of the drug/metabolite transporter (DMT) superfamily n=1 Tax=Amycolatopsis marina TaxID=490629 RepID=A0A1I1A6I6_9PSEU|nr:DMT family transporter [Amycolatopsis marina]SFB32168.1 Permease of the drug/metabolite transporter (DMT) superfamily [Amycolatopsis marina]